MEFTTRQFISHQLRSITCLSIKSIVLISLVGLLLVSCSNANKLQLVEGKVNVITSFYPLFDFAQKIGGDYVKVTNLVPAGVEPHDWSPKSGMIRNMTSADLFVYHGAGLEGWVDDFLSSLHVNSSLVVVKAVTGIHLIPVGDEAQKKDKVTQPQDEATHDHASVDPHTWLSPVNAILLAENIRNGLIQADPANQVVYEANYEQLANRLTQLDDKFRTSLATLNKKEIVVSHEAFSYLCREYGLKQVAIMGLSPDAEPTAQKIKEVNDFIKEHDVKYIFFEQLVSDKLAKTLANDSNIETLVLNPLEGLTEAQLAEGMDYFSVMESNLEHLIQALQ